jgi:hypothetical protein
LLSRVVVGLLVREDCWVRVCRRCFVTFDVLVGGGELQILLKKHYCPQQQKNGEEEHHMGFSKTVLLPIDWACFVCLFCPSVLLVMKVQRKWNLFIGGWLLSVLE